MTIPVPGGQLRLEERKSAPLCVCVPLPPNGFCYKYILLDMKGSLTISASDLKCCKIFLERKSEVKQQCAFLGLASPAVVCQHLLPLNQCLIKHNNSFSSNDLPMCTSAIKLTCCAYYGDDPVTKLCGESFCPGVHLLDFSLVASQDTKSKQLEIGFYQKIQPFVLTR